MTPEQALQLIMQRFDTVSGCTPPQVRQMDQAFQVLAVCIRRLKAHGEESSKVEGQEEPDK